MSVVNELGGKVVLPRLGPDRFWTTVARHYAADNPQRWKRLAMIALHESAGWPMSCIGEVFGHNKGHVSRTIEKTKAELRHLFDDGRESD